MRRTDPRRTVDIAIKLPQSDNALRDLAQSRAGARPRALIAMCGAACLLSLMGVSTKFATRSADGLVPLPACEIAAFRYAMGMLALLVYARIKPTNLLGTDRIGLLWRGISGGIAATAFFIGIQTTTLIHATLLNNTNVIWASLFAISVLGEALSPIAMASVLAALVGVVCVTNTALGKVGFGDAVSLFSGVMAGLAIVQIRKLRRTESSLAVFFYFNLVGFPIGLAALVFTGTHALMPGSSQMLALAAVGVTSVGGQLLMTFGYKELPAAQGSLIILTSVLLSALLSHWLFHDPFTVNTWIGGILIVGSAVALSLSPARTT